jgi:SM-20-related protein
MSGPVELRLNPALDPAQFADTYARQGWVQIPDIFEPVLAEALEQVLARGTPWDMALSTPEGKDEVLDRAAIQALGREKLTEKLADLTRRAGVGFAYCYLCYPMIDARLKGRDPGHPLHDLTDFINSPQFLEFGRRVIRAETITKADAQATFYRPNDFLSLHNDLGTNDQRRAAYTLGFTRNWRTDWGGQLLFHDSAGDVSLGLMPRFNVLTLFSVPQWHSVAPVAPYAAAQRLSVVGWLRDDPPGAKG